MNLSIMVTLWKEESGRCREKDIMKRWLLPGGVLLGIFAGVVPPASPNTDPISDQKMSFPIPVFRPGLKNPYPFSDLTLYVIKHSICISAEQKST